MRKSQLLSQNEQLFSKLQILNAKNEELKNENKLLKEKIESLTLQIDSYEIENEGFKIDLDEEFYDNDESEEELSEISLDDEFVPVSAEKESYNFSPEMEYGSEIIGKIVMQSVEYTNKLSELGKSNVKELVNLILGKTEIAKSEILDISLSDTSLENKYSMMDNELNETVEYFKSVLEQ